MNCKVISNRGEGIGRVFLHIFNDHNGTFHGENNRRSVKSTEPLRIPSNSVSGNKYSKRVRFHYIHETTVAF